MTLLVAATLLMSPVSSDALTVGPAAYYSPAYDRGGWDAIIDRRIAWGQLEGDVVRDGMYCVQPDHELGDRLLVVNAMTGESIVCTVADAVAPRDQPHWRAWVVIELSWSAFVAAGGRATNRFVVTEVQS